MSDSAACPWPKHLGEWCVHEDDANMGLDPDGPKMGDIPTGLCPNCLRPPEEHSFAGSFGPDASDELKCPPDPWKKASA